MLSEIIRWAAYWSVDFLRGSKVRRHLRDISFIMKHPDDVADHQQKQLKKLISFATKNTRFYSSFNENCALSDFPIIDKSFIKENYDSLKSPMCNSNAIGMHTSGSTGTPFVIMQDQNKRNRVFAEMMYFWGISGYKIGMRYVFLRKWNNINKKSRFTVKARNLIMEDVTVLDEVTFKRIKDRLTSDKKIKMIIGYASTLDLLAKYLQAQGATPDNFNVKTIISGSEILTNKTHNILKNVFGCNVVSLYSNQENGMLAVECNENKEFHLNTASYIFEILKIDSDVSADYGEIGRVVITDLYNYAMPVLRYDTGDLAIRKKNSECALKSEAVSSIEGRRVDIVYTVDGVPLSPHTITNGLWKFTGLKQFQLIQKSKDHYKFIVNDEKNIYSDSELSDTCKEFFGQTAHVEIERVNNIPVLASGKFKYLICEWKAGENSI